MPTPSRFWSWAGLATIAATTLVLLAGPVFPSQDGPVHLYYVDVLRGVLAHSGPYAQYFELKSLLTPYALEYYALLALETVFSAAAAEKVLLVCYIFTFGLGFRYLVESVAQRHSPWTLAGIPFTMHIMIYLGFLNYCFAVALLLFLCGFWIRHAIELNARRIVALLAGLVLMLLTHPVPVAVFLVFCGLYWAARVWADSSGGVSSWMASARVRLRPLLLLAAMGVVAVAWVSLFTNSGTGPGEGSITSQYGLFTAVASEVQMQVIAPFASTRYRAGLMLIAALAAGTLAIGGWEEKGRLRPAAVALLAASTLCFVLFCFVPQSVNGSFYFSQRFPLLWLLFLLAAAAAVEAPPRWNQLAGMVGIGVTAAVLTLQWGAISRIDAEIAPALEAAPAQPGSAGLVIGNWRAVPAGLAFDPYFWCGAHYFRRSHAILLNTPWMDLPILLLRPQRPSPWNYLDPPVALEAMRGDRAAPELDFVIEEREPDEAFDRVLTSAGWTLAPDSGPMLRIFRHDARLTR